MVLKAEGCVMKNERDYFAPNPGRHKYLLLACTVVIYIIILVASGQ